MSALRRLQPFARGVESKSVPPNNGLQHNAHRPPI